ncbi:DNA primase, partial [Streptococcus suis]|nr:DNA primase [Streptococcus suis]
MNLKELQEQFNQSKTLEPPKSMRELYNRLWELGEAWRSEHKEEKEITRGNRKGEVETKIPRPSVAEVANILLKHCYFTFIGYSKLTDSSQLYIYHLDLGYY